MEYVASETRYNQMLYLRCGISGINLPAISFGLWHNFGEVDDCKNSQQMLRRAFDLANNYGAPPGSAEETFGAMIEKDFKLYRDEMIISTKAVYTMWTAPFFHWGMKSDPQYSRDYFKTQPFAVYRTRLSYSDC